MIRTLVPSGLLSLNSFSHENLLRTEKVEFNSPESSKKLLTNSQRSVKGDSLQNIFFIFFIQLFPKTTNYLLSSKFGIHQKMYFPKHPKLNCKYFYIIIVISSANVKSHFRQSETKNDETQFLKQGAEISSEETKRESAKRSKIFTRE